MIEVLLHVLAAYYLTRLLREWGPVKRLVRAERKPWACHVCMSAWSSLAWWLATQAWQPRNLLVPGFWLKVAVSAALVLTLLELHGAWVYKQGWREHSPDEYQPPPPA